VAPRDPAAINDHLCAGMAMTSLPGQCQSTGANYESFTAQPYHLRFP
jgi:hypothetical protein